MEKEPDVYVGRGWIGLGRCHGGIGHQFPGERRRVVRDAVEVRIILRRQVGQAKEGLHAAVRAELDIQQGRCGGGGECRIEGSDDLRGHNGTCHRPNGRGGVVSQVKFMCVCQRSHLEEGARREQLGIGKVRARVVDGGNVEQIKNRIGIFEIGFVCGKGAIDHRRQGSVEGLRALEQVEIGGREKVLVTADLRIGTVGAALQPGRVLAAGSGADGLQRDQLIPIERRLHQAAIAKSLGPEGLTHGRIEALEKAESAVLQDVIHRGRSCDLRLLHEIRIQAEDGIGGPSCDISVTEVGAAGEDFTVPEIGQAGRREGFGRAVAMTREDVDAQDCFGTGRAHCECGSQSYRVFHGEIESCTGRPILEYECGLEENRKRSQRGKPQSETSYEIQRRALEINALFLARSDPVDRLDPGSSAQSLHPPQ